MSLSNVVRIAACALALSAPAVALSLTPRVAAAEDVAYVDCRWQPYESSWACALPQTFTQGRFAPPPDFRQDKDSIESRKQAWSDAKASPGARSHGRVGVFIPGIDGWMFVPGTAWSPGDPVFLPREKSAKNDKDASKKNSG